MFNENSAAMNISSLGADEVFTKSTFIPMKAANANRIGREKSRLNKLLSPVVARVREDDGNRYTMHTTVAFTRSYDVIVSISVMRTEDNEEL